MQWWKETLKYSERPTDIQVKNLEAEHNHSQIRVGKWQMAVNMVNNLWRALKQWPIVSTTVWMDSMVSLYWIFNPGKPWKTFVENRVQKISGITSEAGINWKYCPTDKNLADLGSRGAGVNKLETGEWFNYWSRMVTR